MASWIALDWDQDQFHVVVAQTARRGVRVTRALTWPHPEPFTPSTADRVGAALRGFLASANITAAPVIVGLGRDRVFLKELRFPSIAAHEEANLVRFQTAKELTESIESYAVDYVHLNGNQGERQIMTVAVRRDIVAMVQTLCQSAGLKLHAVTPRVFGVAQAVSRAVGANPDPLTPDRLNVVLAIGQRWAELCFFRGDRFLQAQALANGPLLTSEIKRNLAVFQAQHAVSVDLSGPDCLYVFGAKGSALDALRGGQTLPVQLLDPLQAEPELSANLANTGHFAGGVGLVALWSQTVQRPANLAAPKRQSAPVSAGRQRGMLWGAGLAVGMVIFVGLLWGALAYKRAQLGRLIAEKNAFDEQLVKVKQDRADIEALKDWEQSTVSWLDELHDLTARFPYQTGFRVNQFSATSAGTKKSAKDGHIGKIAIIGLTPPGHEDYVKQLNQSMSRDAHVKPHIERFFDGQKYEMKIEIIKQPASSYTTPFGEIPPRPRIAAPAPKAAPIKPPEEMPEDPDAKEDGK